MSEKAKRAFMFLGVIVISFLLASCGLFTNKKENLDPPQDVNYLDENEDVDNTPEEAEGNDEEETSAETMMIDLYLVDKNGYVVAQTLPLPKTVGVAKQALTYLVTDGPISEIIPNGFRTVIPAGTEVDVDIQDGVAIVDFSEEFANYHEQDELRILQSITWTLTQFDTIDSVKIMVNGYPLTEMPVSGTPISEDGLTRDDGINLDMSVTGDITNTRPVTVYYLAQQEDKPYYVPVTKRVSNKINDDITAIVHVLAEGPGRLTNLISAVHKEVELLDDPVLEDGIVTLNFNEFIFGSSEQKMITDETLQSLVLSLTEQQGIESVAITVNGNEELINEDGEPITAPVTRPEKVNSSSF